MALQNSVTNEYLKIYGVGFRISGIRVRTIIFKDVNQASRYPDNIEEYESFKPTSFTYSDLSSLNPLADGTKSLKANLVAKMYEVIKTELGTDWQDV